MLLYCYVIVNDGFNVLQICSDVRFVVFSYGVVGKVCDVEMLYNVALLPLLENYKWLNANGSSD